MLCQDHSSHPEIATKLESSVFDYILISSDIYWQCPILICRRQRRQENRLSIQGRVLPSTSGLPIRSLTINMLQIDRSFKTNSLRACNRWIKSMSKTRAVFSKMRIQEIQYRILRAWTDQSQRVADLRTPCSELKQETPSTQLFRDTLNHRISTNQRQICTQGVISYR